MAVVEGHARVDTSDEVVKFGLCNIIEICHIILELMLPQEASQIVKVKPNIYGCVLEIADRVSLAHLVQSTIQIHVKVLENAFYFVR